MKRAVLLSLGLTFMMAAYVGCLPADSGGGTGKGGTNGQGTGGSGQQGVAGTQGNAGNGGTGGDQGTGGTNPQGTGGNGTGGTNPQGTGGNGTGGNGTGGNGTGGNGTGGNGTGGSNPQGTGGRGGAGGTAGGAAGRGGAGGTAGGAAGRGGAGGTAGTGGSAAGTTGTGGTGGDFSAVAAPLDGFMLLGPCITDTQAAVCATVRSGMACPGQNTDFALSGILTTDKTVTLGGTAGQMYTIILHVQGEVESKQYGGMDQNSTLASPKADGWCKGGTPTSADYYNVYMLRVTAPGATTHTDYFLNSIQPPGTSNHTTYGIDYTTPAAGGALALTVQGGSTVRLVAADRNCSMIKNCGPTQNDGNTCAAPIILSNVEMSSVTKNPTFNFNTAYNGQWIVLTVKGVTSP